MLQRGLFLVADTYNDCRQRLYLLRSHERTVLSMGDYQIELAFVRVLSVHWLRFAGPSNAEKRERIRSAIFNQRLADQPFETGETYREAFARCYHRPLGTPLTEAVEPRTRGPGRPRSD